MTTYIKLDSANETYQELYDSLDDRSGYATEGQKAIEKLMTKLNSLPTISPESMIEEMMEIETDKLNDLNPSFEVKLIRTRKLILQKLLKKFKS